MRAMLDICAGSRVNSKLRHVVWSMFRRCERIEMKQNWPKLSAIVFTGTVLDLWSKHWVSTHFSLGESKPIIDGLLSFTLVHNRGAAFGMGHQLSAISFIVVSIVAIG